MENMKELLICFHLPAVKKKIAVDQKLTHKFQAAVKEGWVKKDMVNTGEK